MRIVVDKMPKTPEECPYREKQQNFAGASWIVCGMEDIDCKDTKECPFFAGESDKNAENNEKISDQKLSSEELENTIYQLEHIMMHICWHDCEKPGPWACDRKNKCDDKKAIDLAVAALKEKN